jgi:hypothetical protein
VCTITPPIVIPTGASPRMTLQVRKAILALQQKTQLEERRENRAGTALIEFKTFAE